VADGFERPGINVSDAIKRGVDIAGSALLLTLLLPVFLLVAVLIKLKSPGAAFFRQVRVGRMMKPFTMIKFRTMHANANQALHHEFYSNFIKSKADAQDTGTAQVFKLANDPRVTPLGRVLRKTSIDELPQLWNVLRGDMSLVGPRPPLHYEVEQYQRWHRRRVLEVKPGLTGLWQVSGRSRTTFDDMVRLDLRYAKSCSLWIDLKILVATPLAVIAGKDAC
jgi:lipopolysaccharide/colanic/teichoic acid biosynthesis glycosyltransferase